MNRIKQIYKDTLCCEPILRRMPNGELLCVAQCGDISEPAPGNRVYVLHSGDNGETWTRPVSIFPEDGQAVYATEVMVVENEVSVFLTLHNGGFINWNCVVMKSTDNGYTWSNAGPPPHYGSFTFFRGMLRLKSGTLLVPYQHYDISPEQNRLFLEKKERFIMKTYMDEVENGVVLSHDNGKTYEPCNRPVKSPTVNGWAWSEPTLAELSDGRVAMLLRKCASGFLWYSESLDGGLTWSPEVKTDIPNPSNKPKLIPLPDGKIALIHTPNNKGYEKSGWAQRFPLEVWITNDDMKTWPYKRVMTEFPGSYDYADGFYENGHILFSIEHNRQAILFFDHAIEL